MATPHTTPNTELPKPPLPIRGGGQGRRVGGGVDAISRLSARQRRMNVGAGVILLGFTGATYYWTIMRMKGHDPLKEVEEEAQVNLHKSGLKVDIKTPQEIAAEAQMAQQQQNAVAAALAPAAPARPQRPQASLAAGAPSVVVVVPEPQKKLGWRKYILFGPRREA
eukprot:TRINITY_DN8548_c0_g1_i1.p1 TRINITY_DN8548_c0_g1~~TRINITY_DN8548_c0_g1_i1.p1  ORF type:complete len:166 (-),score=60.92 TRINITY_DN8548_c0_g1_i1:23-520(-)